jgi:hypothetical protein
MPLIKKSSKKAFEKNVKTEMEANPGKENRAQNLAIAYSTQRAARAKGKAQGGEIRQHNPKLEESKKVPHERPLPAGYDVITQPHTGRWHVKTPEGGLIPGVSWDTQEGAHEAAHRHFESKSTGREFVPGSSKDRFAEGGEVCPHCGKMKDGGEVEPQPAPSPDVGPKMGAAFKSIREAFNGPEEPEQKAEGGSVEDEESMVHRFRLKNGMEVFHVGDSEHEARRKLSLRRDGTKVSDEYLPDEYLGAVPSAKFSRSKADGGMVEDIMARRRRKLQDGQVDIDSNADEESADLSPYDRENMLAVKKELYDDEQLDKDPEDSNEHGDEIEEDTHDMVPEIRRRMKHRSK